MFPNGAALANGSDLVLSSTRNVKIDGSSEVQLKAQPVTMPIGKYLKRNWGPHVTTATHSGHDMNLKSMAEVRVNYQEDIVQHMVTYTLANAFASWSAVFHA